MYGTTHESGLYMRVGIPLRVPVGIVMRNQLGEFPYYVLHDRGIRGLVDGNSSRGVRHVHQSDSVLDTTLRDHFLDPGCDVRELYFRSCFHLYGFHGVRSCECLQVQRRTNLGGSSCKKVVADFILYSTKAPMHRM